LLLFIVVTVSVLLRRVLGDYGKLGHGNNVTQKLPRLILGPFNAKVSSSLIYSATFPIIVYSPHSEDV